MARTGSLPGPGIGALLAARVCPERAGAMRFASSRAIREEIGRAIPLYAGVERLNREGDQLQWGGPRLFADGRFATPDGKARFSVVVPRERKAGTGRFYLSTRRGKQFNSMVQRSVDRLTGAAREDVFLSDEDADRRGVRDGDRLRLVSRPNSSRAAPESTPSGLATSRCTGRRPTCCSRVRRETPSPTSPTTTRS